MNSPSAEHVQQQQSLGSSLKFQSPATTTTEEEIIIMDDDADDEDLKSSNGSSTSNTTTTIFSIEPPIIHHSKQRQPQQPQQPQQITIQQQEKQVKVELSPKQQHELLILSPPTPPPTTIIGPRSPSKQKSHLVVCIQQVDADFLTPTTWRPASQRGQFSCEKDEKGLYIIRQPPEADFLFLVTVGMLSLFIVPCFGLVMLLSLFWTVEFRLTLNDTNEEFCVETFGSFWENKRLETTITIPYQSIAAFKVVMNESVKKDDLPDGKLFIITKDNTTIEVKKDYVNYYSVLAMAQKATELINSKLSE